jgi:hypothetical protein
LARGGRGNIDTLKAGAPLMNQAETVNPVHYGFVYTGHRGDQNFGIKAVGPQHRGIDHVAACVGNRFQQKLPHRTKAGACHHYRNRHVETPVLYHLWYIA